MQTSGSFHGRCLAPGGRGGEGGWAAFSEMEYFSALPQLGAGLRLWKVSILLSPTQGMGKSGGIFTVSYLFLMTNARHVNVRKTLLRKSKGTQHSLTLEKSLLVPIRVYLSPSLRLCPCNPDSNRLLGAQVLATWFTPLIPHTLHKATGHSAVSRPCAWTEGGLRRQTTEGQALCCHPRAVWSPARQLSPCLQWHLGMGVIAVPAPCGLSRGLPESVHARRSLLATGDSPAHRAPC